MARKRAVNQQALLTHSIRTRVTEKVYIGLEKLQNESSCQSIAQVARKILSNEKINGFYRDISMNAPMEEMALIRDMSRFLSIKNFTHSS